MGCEHSAVPSVAFLSSQPGFGNFKSVVQPGALKALDSFRRSLVTAHVAEVQRVQQANEKIQCVSCEFCTPGHTPPEHLGKGRSMLVVDENVLQVAPIEPTSTAAPEKAMFRAFSTGFLNTSKGKRRGIVGAPPEDPHVGTSRTS